MTNTKQDVANALEQLRAIFKPGDTLYCIVRSVARSGMSRRIDYYAKDVDGSMRWVTPHLVRLGVPDESYASWRKRGDYDGARIDGCGMNMCFESAYRLGRKLWPNGFGGMPCDRGGGGACGVRPETREDAAKQVKAGWKFWGRNGDTSGWETDGGYALKHRTL